MTASMVDIVKAYDIRGLVGEQLTTQVSWALGAAFAELMQGEEAASMVVGHDMRPSSPALAAAFAQGASSAGVPATSVGLCSTDGLYYASGATSQPGAMFTASHNPASYNGIKLCRAGARPVGQDSGLIAVRDRAQELLDAGAPPQDLPQVSAVGAVGGHEVAVPQIDITADYATHLRSLVDLSDIRPLRVVVDAGNGMAGLTTPAVLGTAAGLPELPVTIIPLYFELDGTFPNHEANPLDPANLRDLQAAVREHAADIGLAFDGDADRCFVIDERGEPVTPSALTALVAQREIAKSVTAGITMPTVIYNAITSRVVPEVIADAGAVAVRSRVGHSFIKAQMAAHDAIFGGEHSAHYYFKDFWFADTGMLAALHMLAALGSQTEPLSVVMAPYEKYAASGEINSKVADPAAATRAVRVAYADQPGIELDTLDGLSVIHAGSQDADDPMWWFNVRPSNTEPLLRLNVEAADHATMEDIRDAVLAIIRAS